MKWWTRRGFMASSAAAALVGLSPVAHGGPVPWRNWSGGLVCQPRGRFSPGSVEELANFLSTSTGVVRPVGAGHSFSPLVPTDGHLIVLDQLTGISALDPDLLQASIHAGTRLGDVGAPLARAGQGMFNLPDIDRQTVAGAIATATHGTGIQFACLSGYVTALQLITPSGEVLDLAPGDPRFDAARVSLGALGVVTQATFQNRKAYRLKARNWVQPIEEVLAQFDERAARHRHFEMFPLTHSTYALTLAIDETDEPVNNPPPSTEEAAAFARAMAHWATLPPRERMPAIDELVRSIQPTETVDESYRILSNVRNSRFNEMEYAVPLAAGAECLREILRTIIDKQVDVVFPLEYRYVRRDDTWLSMSSGDEDHAAISIHRTASEDYRPYFDLIEPIFWKYGGRPHWGKIHSLGAAELSQLYPHFEDFQALREELDPAGRMLNAHLRRLFVS